MSNLSKPISIRFPESGRKRLIQLANENHQRLADLVRSLIIDALEYREINFNNEEFFPAN